MTKVNQEQVRAAYYYDLTVSDYWYGKLMEEAIELDEIAALVNENPTEGRTRNARNCD